MPKTNLEEKFNWPLVGNKHIIDFLSKGLINNQIAHFYIFLGPADIGKTTVANHFSKILLCQGKDGSPRPCDACPSCQSWQPINISVKSEENNLAATHGDFHLIKRDAGKKNISIEQVRGFIRSLGMSSFLGSYKIGVVKGADTLSGEAANALLKTLEEPKENVVIILIASSLESLPATIVSRSQVLNFYPVGASIIYDYLMTEHKVSRSVAKNLSKICLGRPALAVKFLKDKDFYEDYLTIAKIFLAMASEDINGRLKKIDNILAGGSYSQEAVKAATNAIQIWQGLVRDLLLIEFGQDNLIQNQPVSQELKAIKNKFNLKNLLRLNQNFKQAKEYLYFNVSPKLVIENLVINF